MSHNEKQAGSELSGGLGRDQAEKILALMTPLPGRTRTVNKCLDCGHLFGRQFIPYGLGYGMSTSMCMCQLTSNRPSSIVLEATP